MLEQTGRAEPLAPGSNFFTWARVVEALDNTRLSAKSSVPKYIYIYPLSRDMPAPDIVSFGNTHIDRLIFNLFNKGG